MKTVRLRGSDYTRYMKDTDGARASTQKSLFDEFGPVRIAGPNGRFVKVVRSDPGVPQSIEERQERTVDEATAAKQQDAMKRMKNSGNVQKAPSPKSCKCSSWPVTENEVVPRDDRGRPTEHRRTCAFKKMWERRATHIKNVPISSAFEPTHHKASAPKNSSNPQPRLLGGKPDAAVKLKNKADKVPAPHNCTTCKDWKKPKRMDADLHHEMCPHFKKHKQLVAAQKAMGVVPAAKVSSKQAPLQLFDLEQQEVVREAEADEVLEARRNMRDSGAAIIVVDEKSYLVMYEDGTAIEPAEVEPVSIVEEDEEEEEVGDTEPPPADLNHEQAPAENPA